MTLLFVFLTVQNPPVIDGFIETLLVDYRFKLRNLVFPPSVPSNIMIVMIDEKSLSAYGRWPWKRNLQASLIEKVLAGNPGVVAVDIFYPESESPTSDKALAEVLRRHRDRLIVALGFEVEEGKVFKGEVEDVLYESAIQKIEHTTLLKSLEACRVLLPPEPIASAAAFGHVYSLPDRDGKLRWESLYLKYGGEYFPSLALQAVRVGLSIPADKVSIVGGVGVVFGRLLIPTDDFGRLHINYLGQEGKFQSVSAHDILSGTADTKIFEKKIVFIGTSAIATYDIKITPFSANTTGVEKNATVAANIISRNFIQKPPVFVDVMVVLIAGVFIVIIGNRFRALHSLIGLLMLAFITVISNQALFTVSGLRLNLVYPLFTVITGGVWIVSYKYLIEERRAREIRRMFSSYVSPKIVKELIENPEMASPGGTRKEVTVIFSDIKDFTSFAESKRPEEVVSMLNEYFQVMIEVILKWDGTLDKFMGDEIMAFWGAPVEQRNHAELALTCALEMRRELKRLQEQWRADSREVLNAGIGINTGEAVVGNIGVRDKKMDYTIIGDHVNLGARIERLTRHYNAEILMTEFTLSHLPPDFMEKIREAAKIKEIGEVTVKGRKLPVRIYNVSVKYH